MAEERRGGSPCLRRRGSRRRRTPAARGSRRPRCGWWARSAICSAAAFGTRLLQRSSRRSRSSCARRCSAVRCEALRVRARGRTRGDRRTRDLTHVRRSAVTSSSSCVGSSPAVSARCRSRSISCAVGSRPRACSTPRASGALPGASGADRCRHVSFQRGRAARRARGERAGGCTGIADPAGADARAGRVGAEREIAGALDALSKHRAA